MPILSSARVTASSQPTLPSTQEAGTSAPIHHHGKLLLVTGMVMARQISYASAQHTLILSSARATASSQPTLPSTQEVGTSAPILHRGLLLLVTGMVMARQISCALAQHTLILSSAT